MILTRYEIHSPEGEVKGAVLGVFYRQAQWEEICIREGFDPDEAEAWSDGYELQYPSLPEGEYLFWFTPSGDENFRKFYGHLLAEAGALSCGGQLVILTREYQASRVIYEDKDQVVYLR